MPVSSNSTPAPEIHRDAIEDEIERLIAILDALDPDPDLEPSLGYGSHLAEPDGVDLEGDDSDDEPSLGSQNVQLPPPMSDFYGRTMTGLFPMLHELSPLTYGNNPGFSQLQWCVGHNTDGSEPDVDEEYTLGASAEVCQANWGKAATDYEEQCEGEGELDHRGNPVDCGWPGAVFGASVGLEPFQDPNVIPVRHVEQEVANG